VKGWQLCALFSQCSVHKTVHFVTIFYDTVSKQAQYIHQQASEKVLAEEDGDNDLEL